MRNITASGNLYGEQINIKQISKAKAKKLFAEGQEIYLQSSNMYPFGMWQNVCPIKLDEEQLKSDTDVNNFSIELYSQQVGECNNVFAEEWRKNMLAENEAKLKEYQTKVIDASTQFESVVSNYAFYNCDSERGKYVNFYAKQ